MRKREEEREAWRDKRVTEGDRRGEYESEGRETSVAYLSVKLATTLLTIRNLKCHSS